MIEDVETHYRRSLFIKEICVMGSERLFAVVVPDLDRLRSKRIVNAGDLIRFEMEGLTAELPANQRVLGYDIWFEPLPRTTAQGIDRDEIARRTRERQEIAAGRRDAPISAADREWMTRPRTAALLGIIRERLAKDTRLGPD